MSEMFQGEAPSLSFAFVEGLEVVDPEAPAAFPLFDETIETEYQCPACGYQWSGQPKVSEDTSLIDET